MSSTSFGIIQFAILFGIVGYAVFQNLKIAELVHKETGLDIMFLNPCWLFNRKVHDLWASNPVARREITWRAKRIFGAIGVFWVMIAVTSGASMLLVTK